MIDLRYVLPAGLLIVVAAALPGCGNGEIQRIAGTLAMADTRAVAAPTRHEAVTAEPAIVVDEEEPAGCVDAEAAVAPQTGFAFPNDALGTLVRELLTPPRQVATEPVPYVGRPRPRTAIPTERTIAGSPAPLAGVQLVYAPRLIDEDRGAAIAQLAARDLPPLVVVADPARPQRPLLPMGALAYASSPPAEVAPSPTPLRLLSDPKPTAALDPSPEASRQIGLPRPVVQRGPAPFLRLVIPDPFESVHDVQVRTAVVESDPPPSPRGVPARPTLSVETGAP